MQMISLGETHFPSKALAVVGHVGVGHVHGHAGLVQDDSAGFAVVIALLLENFPLDLHISHVEANLKTHSIRVVTQSGGIGIATTHCAFSVFEAEILQRAMGKNAGLPHRVAVETLGRMWGQGADPVPVALEAATALAVLDSFMRVYPADFVYCTEGIQGCCGASLGTIVAFEGHKLALVATINAAVGGLGPIEDGEGNIPLGGKHGLYSSLGMPYIPTIVVESKACVPDLCPSLKGKSLVVRTQEKVDNTVVAAALLQAAQTLCLPVYQNVTAYPREATGLRDVRLHLVGQLRALVQELESATTSLQKVTLVSRIITLCREDAGGMTYMSDAVHAQVGHSGIIPGTAAVLSMVVPQQEIALTVLPLLDENDLSWYTKVVIRALHILLPNLALACAELRSKKPEATVQNLLQWALENANA